MSLRFGTVATFYCTNPTYELVGPQKITCLKDGTFNAEPPTCEPGMLIIYTQGS